MARSIASKVAWVGRTASMVFGLALVLALLFGVATMALGANGGNFILGKTNVATLMSRLAGPDGVNGTMFEVQNNNSGTDDTALSLKVQSGEAPMKVNSDAVVTNLNADKLDGEDSTEIGVNGLQVVSDNSAYNSDSPKGESVFCPSGKSPVGTGFRISGGTSGSAPNAQTDVVVDELLIIDRQVYVRAYEESLTSANWYVEAIAVCAQAP